MNKQPVHLGPKAAACSLCLQLFLSSVCAGWGGVAPAWGSGGDPAAWWGLLLP